MITEADAPFLPPTDNGDTANGKRNSCSLCGGERRTIGSTGVLFCPRCDTTKGNRT